MKASSQAVSRHMRMFFVLLCHILLITLTISFINYDNGQRKLKERRQQLDRTINELAQRVVAAAADPGVRVNEDLMKNYVEQAYTTLRRIDKGNGELPGPF
ncbi:unnamed protein product [Cylicocyclus nassatus]|uniref:Uncharacterized protein n=1 Tax=Cylicocyclus nassatus TaxID=53992 RepID=A0AA36MDB6_CYLNA|nr:unnamed protein product [Cylicocyclus nassatus]